MIVTVLHYGFTPRPLTLLWLTTHLFVPCLFAVLYRDSCVRLSTSKSSTSLPAHVPLLVDMTLTRRVVASR